MGCTLTTTLHLEGKKHIKASHTFRPLQLRYGMLGPTSTSNGNHFWIVQHLKLCVILYILIQRSIAEYTHTKSFNDFPLRWWCNLLICLFISFYNSFRFRCFVLISLWSSLGQILKLFELQLTFYASWNIHSYSIDFNIDLLYHWNSIEIQWGSLK